MPSPMNVHLHSDDSSVRIPLSDQKCCFNAPQVDGDLEARYRWERDKEEKWSDQTILGSIFTLIAHFLKILLQLLHSSGCGDVLNLGFLEFLNISRIEVKHELLTLQAGYRRQNQP
jgi:hypothetical protein